MANAFKFVDKNGSKVDSQGVLEQQVLQRVLKRYQEHGLDYSGLHTVIGPDYSLQGGFFAPRCRSDRVSQDSYIVTTACAARAPG